MNVADSNKFGWWPTYDGVLELVLSQILRLKQQFGESQRHNHHIIKGLRR